MMFAIFILLLVIILLLCVPVKERGNTIAGLMKGLMILFWVAGGLCVLFIVFCWSIWGGGIFLFVTICIVAFLLDSRDNRKIRRGDPVAIAERIDYLMKSPLNYDRTRAEAAIYRLRFGSKS